MDSLTGRFWGSFAGRIVGSSTETTSTWATSFWELYEKEAFFAFSTASTEMTGGSLRTGASAACPFVSVFREGSLGGREGLGGGAGLTAVLEAGVEIVVQLGARLTYFGFSSEYFLTGDCDCGLLAGRGGRWLSPHAGAFTRLAESVDFVRVAVTLEVRPSLGPLAADATDTLLGSSSEVFLLGRGGGCFLGGGAG